MSTTWLDETSDTPAPIRHGDGDGEDPATYVTVTLEMPDDSEIEGSVSVVVDPTPDAMARLIVRAALAAAAAHGTDTWIALQQLLVPTPPRSSP